jgi:hypothetical protein
MKTLRDLGVVGIMLVHEDGAQVQVSEETLRRMLQAADLRELRGLLVGERIDHHFDREKKSAIASARASLPRRTNVTIESILALREEYRNANDGKDHGWKVWAANQAHTSVKTINTRLKEAAK